MANDIFLISSCYKSTPEQGNPSRRHPEVHHLPGQVRNLYTMYIIPFLKNYAWSVHMVKYDPVTMFQLVYILREEGSVVHGGWIRPPLLETLSNAAAL